MQPVGHRGIDPKMEGEPLLERLVVEQRAHRCEQGVEVEVGRRHRLLGLDPGDLEDFADHLEQALAGAAHGPHHVLLLARERGAAQQVGHADDRVQRRPQLVAHGREEAALGAARLLGAGERIGELGQQRGGVGRQHEKSDPETGRERRLAAPVGARGDHQGEARRGCSAAETNR